MVHNLSSEKLRQLLSSIDRLYEAACDPEKWPLFLAAASELFECQGCQIGHHDLSNHSLSFSRLHGYEWDEDHYRRYDELMPGDPRVPHFAANPFKAVHCRMHVSDEELHNSRVYQEVLSPGCVEYSLGVNLMEGKRSLSYFIALRNKSQKQFDENDCALLDELIPHLNRAILLQRDVGTIDFERNIAADTLDNLAIGLIIVDRFAQIRFTNATGQDVLDAKDGLAAAGGKLRAPGDQDGVLKQAINRAIHQAQTGSNVSGEAVSVPNREKSDPVSIFISPLFGQHLKSGWVHLREPLAILIVRELDKTNVTRQEVLGCMYGLTRSQARLANLIASGFSLQQAAEEAGITEASARQYLKTVFDKMDVSRQSELVTKALSLPVPIRAVHPREPLHPLS
ncbi:hypothetical protein ABLO27_10665 [Roseibium sp. SCPC15]|uniref:helix-turn-helix transcriptional regulator n=1 Tax=Roseibium sp. SCP15 TaxID=3141376 RepID=UPI0033389B05